MRAKRTMPRSRPCSTTLALIPLLALAWVAAARPVDVPVETTFDENLEGWTIPPEQNSELIYMPTGGNPGGFAFFGNPNETLTEIEAPGPYHGDWSFLDGAGVLQFDHKIVDLGENPVGPPYLPYEATLAGGGNLARFISDETAQTEWTTVVVPIDEQEWTVEQGSWSALLENVESLRIRIELVSNPGGGDDQDGIDNVRLMEIPSDTPEDGRSRVVTLNAHPNPFSSATTIVFDIPMASETHLDVFDVVGRLVRRLQSGFMEPGRHHLSWAGDDTSGRRVGGGIYFYRLQAGPIEEMGRLTLLD